MQQSNPYEDLIGFHPAIGDRSYHYWRLNSLWDSDLLRERAQKNRQLASDSGDVAYLQYLRTWLEREGFKIDIPAVSSSVPLTTMSKEELDEILDQRKLIKIDIRPRSKSQKKVKIPRVIPCTELMISEPAHQRALALMGCTEPQFTGKAPLAVCTRAVLKYIHTKHLQSGASFKLDDLLRLLLGVSDTQVEKCSYYEYKSLLLKTIAPTGPSGSVPGPSGPAPVSDGAR